MENKILLSVLFAVLIVAGVTGSTYAGIEPMPWHTQVDKLTSAAKGLDSVNRRLAQVFVDCARKPADKGLIRRLSDIADQLEKQNAEIKDAMVGVPVKHLPTEIEIMLMDINRGAIGAAKTARMDIGAMKGGLRDAFVKVQRAAEMIITTVKDWMMCAIVVFEPFNGTSCVVGYPCDIGWEKDNIQNYPTVNLEVVYPDGTGGWGTYPVPNTGYYFDWAPDPSWADPSVICQPFRIKVSTVPDNACWGMSGLFKVGIYPLGCGW